MGKLERLKRRKADVKDVRKDANQLQNKAHNKGLPKVAKRAKGIGSYLFRKGRDITRSIKRLLHITPGVVDGGWHPEAERYPESDAGIMSWSHRKLVWHTTEGVSRPDYSGSSPHFTLDIRTGKLYQHISITRVAMALQNLSGGVETNRAGAMQVELIGRAAESSGWSDTSYKHIARLARWIEKHGGVPRKCTLAFSNTPHRLSGVVWLAYEGHCGHQHVPENDHWDPGAFHIEKVI